MFGLTVCTATVTGVCSRMVVPSVLDLIDPEFSAVLRPPSGCHGVLPRSHGVAHGATGQTRALCLRLGVG